MNTNINKYALLMGTALENHFSNFLIDYWSYSGVTTFARNEKEFERSYIYREPSRKSASSVAGTAYHAALELYFNRLAANGSPATLAEMQEVAWKKIDAVEANEWKLTKSVPSVEEARNSATKTANVLISNFLKEADVYTGLIARVLAVEEKMDGWLVINGVDIPLPCHSILDLVVELKDGRRVIIDHKSKSKFSDDCELAYVGAKQAIVYVKQWETKYPDAPIDEVWYMENKASQNKDRSPQLHRNVIKMDEDTRRLYEAILYEPLRRMIMATQDPDHLYVINDADTLADLPVLYDFWARTLIADIDDFMYLPEDKKALLGKRKAKVRDAEAVGITPRVIRSFRKNAATFISLELREDMTNTEKIEHVLRTFSIPAKVAYSFGAYNSTSYLLEVGAGVMISNISKHALDIANVLNVPSVRILPTLTVYEGRSYLCVEAPSRSKNILLWDPKYLKGYKIPLGLNNFGEVVHWDMNNHSTPHMLICGATGSGKSVCIKSTIEYARLAGVQRIIVLDPKYEFIGQYQGEQGVEVIADIDEIEHRMKQLVAEMQARAKTGESSKTLIVFDEFADAVSSARSGKALNIKDENGNVIGQDKSLEENLKMLLQKGRSLGYRIIAATQRASTKVITGDAKVNFPVQVCFRVPKAVDSKVVLDEEGAETLAGRGDGLIKSPEYLNTVRFQGFYKP
ncbi:MAG: PD-(D/E)XK nuclease family protein [Muribaculaceae bacterium]|nr:PD-(D/E)XK nuclease family protein [Muribaculaceae bacterium]